MKYIVLLGDGMADWPLEELNGKTCLQYANTPFMDKLASYGQSGNVYTVPQGLSPGSDVANLSVLGYNPSLYYSGRSPLEAASMGVELDDNDVAFRCNLVTLNGRGEDSVMEDYSAGHITSDEAAELINKVQQRLGTDGISFYPGVSYRHLMVWRNGSSSMKCTPPHDISGKQIRAYMPVGQGSEVLIPLMETSRDFLPDTKTNKRRREKGLRQANSIWLWGQGKRPSMPTFKEKYGIEGALISAVDLTRGIGAYAGFEILRVPGATGYIDTNYEGKAQTALRALEKVDFVYLHVEAPDEAGHNGDIQTKVMAIEHFDKRIVGPVWEGLKKFKNYRIMVLPDHPTPIAIKTHTSEPVPYVIYDSNAARIKKNTGFDEFLGQKQGAQNIQEGYRLMAYFLGKKSTTYTKSLYTI